MIYTDAFPVRNCLFCETKMNINMGMNMLLELEPPTKVIASSGIPLVTYVCPSCGFVACFNADIIKK
jgi:hypothetical protein